MPDRGEGVADIGLAKFGHRHLARFGDDIEKPAPGLGIAVQLGLATFKGILGSVFQDMKVAPQGVPMRVA